MKFVGSVGCVTRILWRWKNEENPNTHCWERTRAKCYYCTQCRISSL